jgi:hypothetical protein
MTFLLRDVGNHKGEWEEREGALSLSGISWRGKTPALGREVDVRFRLPGVSKELRAVGEILRVVKRSGGIDFRVRFTELDGKSERAITDYLDDHEQGG